MCYGMTEDTFANDAAKIKARNMSNLRITKNIFVTSEIFHITSRDSITIDYY